MVDWAAETGWGAPRIRPVAPFSLHPAAQTLQYGAHCFEGMKAYRSNASDTPHLFRPLLNMERFRRSAERLHLPTFSPEQLLTCIKILVNIEQSWVPKQPDCALYLRPTLMATTPFLGVGPADECVLYVLASPCGPFLPPDHTGPVRMFLEEARTALSQPSGAVLFCTALLCLRGVGTQQNDIPPPQQSVVRAGPGGVGQYKVGGNYAPTIAPQMAARKAHGCAQVSRSQRTPRHLPINTTSLLCYVGSLVRPDPAFSAFSGSLHDCTGEWRQGRLRGWGDEHVLCFQEVASEKIEESDAAHWPRTAAVRAYCAVCRIVPTPLPSFHHRRGNGEKLELATPPLDGTILPGVTRQSVLELARSWRATRGGGPPSLQLLFSQSFEGGTRLL